MRTFQIETHTRPPWRARSTGSYEGQKSRRDPRQLPAGHVLVLGPTASLGATMEIAQPHSQVLEEKLQRVLGTNAQLKADLERDTEPVSKASQR